MRSVAVVHVPVDDRDATEPARCQQVVRCDRRVAEDAEAHPRVGQSMVAWWARQRVAVGDRAVHDGVADCDRAARGEQGNLVGALAEGHALADVHVGVAAVHCRHRGDALDVIRGVEAAHLLDGGRAGRQDDQLVE